MEYLIRSIQQWARDRKLDREKSGPQMIKLQEEVGELAAALLRSDKKKIVDSIGDVFVVLVVLQMQLESDINCSFRECVKKAYDNIKGREGKVVNGVFVKDEYELDK